MGRSLFCLSKKVEFHRYVVLVSNVYLLSVSGTAYMFSALSNDLQLRFGYNSTQIQALGAMGILGLFTNFFGGLFYDRFGPRWDCLISAALVFLGYFLVYLATIGQFTSNIVVMSICFFLAGHGSGWTYNSALATTPKNFPSKDRGLVVGLLVCFFGLCGAIYTEVLRGIFNNHVPTFLLFSSVFFSVSIVICGMFSNVVEESRDIENWKFIYSYVLAIVIALYLGCLNAFAPKDWHTVYTAGVLFVLMALFMLIIYRSDYFVKCERVDPQHDEVNVDQPDKTPTNDKTLFQAVKSLEFWLLFTICFCSIGSALATVTNIGLLIISRDPYLSSSESPEAITLKDISRFSLINTFVALFSIFNTLGRMISGVLSDKLRSYMERETMLCFITFFMMLIQIFMAYSPVDYMYFGIIVIGLCYGATFCLMPVIASDTFGLKYFGSLWGAIIVAGGLGSIALSYLVGRLCDFFAEVSFKCFILFSGCSKVCVGDRCFKYTYFVLLGICSLALILNYFLRVIIAKNKRRAEYVPIK